MGDTENKEDWDLVWGFRNKDKKMQVCYTLNQENKNKILKTIEGKECELAHLYLESGVFLVPRLMKEDRDQRKEILSLKKDLEEAKQTIHDVTKERDLKTRELFDKGTQESKELHIAKIEKENAEERAEGLREQLNILKKKRDDQELNELNKKLDALQISTDKISFNTDRLATAMNARKEGAMSMITPIGEQIKIKTDNVIMMGSRKVIHALKNVASLRKDLDKLTKNGKVSYLFLEGTGSSIGSDLHRKLLPFENIEVEQLVILVIDGADEVDDKDIETLHLSNLRNSAGRLGDALETIPFRKLAVVAGPTKMETIEKSRATILNHLGEKLKYEQDKVVTIDMSKVAKTVDSDTLEKWCKNEWSSVAAVQMMSMVLKWASENVSDTELNPACMDCGFFHENDECFKKEVDVIELSGDKTEDTQNGKPKCPKCPRYHWGICYGNQYVKRNREEDNSRGRWSKNRKVEGK